MKKIYLLLFLLSSTAVFSKPAEITVEEDDLDATNQYIATQWDLINRTVDSFFTNQRSKASENKSSIFVYSSFYKKEGQVFDSEYDFQLKIHLPNTTKKLKIVIEKQQDEVSNALSDTSTANTKIVSKDGTISRTKQETYYTAGGSYVLSKSKYFISFLRFGIRLDVPINPSLKFDVQKTIKTKYTNIGLSQKIIFYRQEGLQEISQLTFNKKLNKHFSADLMNSLVWTDETDIFVLRHGFVISQDLGDEKSLNYSVGTNAKFSPTYHYNSYDTSVSYRQALHSDWLYGTLTLGADFPKSNNFKIEKFAQIRLDLFFKE